MEVNDVIKRFTDVLKSLANHEYRKNRQLGEIAALKADLSADHIIIQEDFSENYTCKQQVEIQSVYYSTTSVTLFTAVVWYKSSDGVVTTRNYVIVSDNLAAMHEEEEVRESSEKSHQLGDIVAVTYDIDEMHVGELVEKVSDN